MPLPTPVCLYDQPRAPNPRRVNIFVAEKGIEIPRQTIDIMKGEHKQEPFLGRVGRAQLPALELEDGTVLIETQAICRYLEALHPEPNLMGTDPLETAVIEMWQRRVEFGLYACVAFAFRHTNPHMAALEEQCSDWGAVNAGRIDERMAELDRRLEGREFLAADRFTIADITALVAVDFLRVLKRRVPEEMPHMAAWHGRVGARPSAGAGKEKTA